MGFDLRSIGVVRPNAPVQRRRTRHTARVDPSPSAV